MFTFLRSYVVEPAQSSLVIHNAMMYVVQQTRRCTFHHSVNNIHKIILQLGKCKTSVNDNRRKSFHLNYRYAAVKVNLVIKVQVTAASRQKETFPGGFSSHLKKILSLNTTFRFSNNCCYC